MNLFDTMINVLVSKQYNQNNLYEVVKTQQEAFQDGSNMLLSDLRLDLDQGLCLIETNLRAVREKVEKCNEIQLNDYVTKLLSKLLKSTGKQHY